MRIIEKAQDGIERVLNSAERAVRALRTSQVSIFNQWFPESARARSQRELQRRAEERARNQVMPGDQSIKG